MPSPPVGLSTRAGTRLVGAWPRPAAHPLVADVVLASGLALAAVLVDAFGHDYRSAAAPAWDLLLAAPLALRRRAPATAGAVLAAVCLAQYLTGVLANGDLLVLVMLYSLGVWEQRRWLLAAALAIAEIGVVLAVTRWAPGPHQWLSGLMATGTVTAAIVLGLYVRTRRAFVTTMVDRAETAERDRDRQAHLAVAEERARLAREMHDVIAHSLAVIITLNDAAAALSAAGTVRDTITQASDVGRQALTEMQRMLGVLRTSGPTDLTPQPGTAQLPDLMTILRSAGLSVALTVTGDPAALPPTTQLAVYRIVQESLTNVLKHGRNVTHVNVAVTCRDHLLRVAVTNDGDLTGARRAASEGHGLIGIRQRVALHNGHVHAGPKPGGGWQLHAELHLDHNPIPA